MAAKHPRRASDNGGKASVKDPTAQTLKCHLINPSLLKREAQHIYSVKKNESYHITRSFGLLAHDPWYADVGADGHLCRPVDVLGALIFERRFQMLVLILNLAGRFGQTFRQKGAI
jgi:hypothetical protein